MFKPVTVAALTDIKNISITGIFLGGHKAIMVANTRRMTKASTGY